MKKWLMAAGLLAAFGCGAEPPSDPKTDLSDKEREQIKKYQDERGSEWGTPKKAKK